MERKQMISVLRALGVSAITAGWLIAAPVASVGASGTATHDSISPSYAFCDDDDESFGGNGGDASVEDD